MENWASIAPGRDFCTSKLASHLNPEARMQAGAKTLPRMDTSPLSRKFVGELAPEERGNLAHGASRGLGGTLLFPHSPLPPVRERVPRRVEGLRTPTHAVHAPTPTLKGLQSFGLLVRDREDRLCRRQRSVGVAHGYVMHPLRGWLEFGHLRAEPALECGGLTPPFSLNMLGLQMPHRWQRR